MLSDKRGFFKRFFSLYWAIVLQNVVVLSVNLADNVMLGSFSEVALSGAASVNQIQFFLQMVVNGIGSGLVVLGSQYWGKGEAGPVRRLTVLAMWGGLLAGLLLFAVCGLFPRFFLGLFTTDPAIIAEGVAYLRILCWTFPVFAATLILQNALQSVGTVKIALYVAIEALVINVILNAVFIPRFGVRGAAAATLISRCASFVSVLLYTLIQDKKLCLKLRHFLKPDTALLGDFLRVSAPVIVVNALWGVSTALQTVVLGHMENAASGAIAAASMATTLYTLLKTASIGSSSVAAIMIGNAVGSGDIDRVRDYAKVMQVLFLAIGLFTGVALFFLRAPILSLYSMSDSTRALADSFLLVLCVTGVGTAYQMPTITGIIRGGGDTKFCMINDLVTIWGVVVPLSLLAAFKFNWSPVAVFACLNCDQIIKCGAAVIHCNRFTWIKVLTR